MLEFTLLVLLLLSLRLLVLLILFSLLLQVDRSCMPVLLWQLFSLNDFPMILVFVITKARDELRLC